MYTHKSPRGRGNKRQVNYLSITAKNREKEKHNVNEQSDESALHSDKGLKHTNIASLH